MTAEAPRSASMDTDLRFLDQLRIQCRVIWALTMREVITRFGREGLGAIWMVAEPAIFIIGVLLIFPFIDRNEKYSVAEYLAVGYPTILLWRNTTNRVVKALEINKALLHHQPIRAIDIIYSRILLEFAGAAGAFTILFLALIQLNICHWPHDPLDMAVGYILIAWFSVGFVLIMAALSELSETIERVSHIILYFMLPFSDVFIPAFAVPEKYRDILLHFPLVQAVEYFHAGYYGPRMQTYFWPLYTILALAAETLFALTLINMAIRRVQIR